MRIGAHLLVSIVNRGVSFLYYILYEYLSFSIKMMEKGEKTDRVSMFIKTRAKKTKNDDGQQVEVHDEEATAVIVSTMYFMYIYIYINNQYIFSVL